MIACPDLPIHRDAVNMMDPVLDELLCRRHPVIFRDRHSDPRTSAMAWGFTCDDGWFTLIDTLCEEITTHVRETKCAPVVAMQVKEKFGTLRFRAGFRLVSLTGTKEPPMIGI